MSQVTRMTRTGSMLGARKATRPGEELTRLFTWEERHRRLAARLLIAFGLTLLVLAVGSVLPDTSADGG
jgi:cation transporter-like permease